MFTHAIVRTPGPDAADGLTTAGLGRADLPTLLRQHAAYVATLEELGLAITRLDPLPGHPDAYFVEDAALVFPELAVITRPGAPERRAEADAIAPAVAAYRTLHRLTAPATLDGGDVLWMDRTVFVGLSERTNGEGAAQLTAILAPHGYTVVDARDVWDALTLARSRASRIDLLLTDIVMPDMNGPQLAQHVVTMHPKIRVLYVSGFPQVSALGGQAVSDRVSFLPKPFTPSTLLASVREALDKQPSRT